MAKKLLVFCLVLALAAAATAGGWYGLRMVQSNRADSLLTEANSHIENANRLLAGLGVDGLGAAEFSSLDNINKSAVVAAGALPQLDQARVETDAAAEAAYRAGGLAILPSWYRDYLAKKEETATLKSRQIDLLSQKTTTLTELYASGTIIFSALEARDRLTGEFQTAYGMIKDDPTRARDSLAIVAQGLRATESQLRAADQEKGFTMLDDLASSVAGYAELAELASELADAAAAGDQPRIQDSSARLETKLEATSLNTGYVESWWLSQITPLDQAYEDMQIRQEELDTAAAALYHRERPPTG